MAQLRAVPKSGGDPVNDVLARLDRARGRKTGYQSSIDRLYGDQPEVLERIMQAHRDRVPFAAIARALSTDDTRITGEMVSAWIERHG